jgi:hypothetical protein
MLVTCVLDVSSWKKINYKYFGRTPNLSGRTNFYKIKKWGGPIFEGRAGIIIYQLS